MKTPFDDPDDWPAPEKPATTALQRALRAVRGEGYTARRLGGGRFHVKQLTFDRIMSRAEILAFAGIEQ